MFQNAMCFVSILINLRCHLGIGLIDYQATLRDSCNNLSSNYRKFLFLQFQRTKVIYSGFVLFPQAYLFYIGLKHLLRQTHSLNIKIYFCLIFNLVTVSPPLGDQCTLTNILKHPLTSTFATNNVRLTAHVNSCEIMFFYLLSLLLVVNIVERMLVNDSEHDAF